MAPIEMLVVDDLASSVSPSSLLQHLPCSQIDTEIFRIRVPLSNKIIVFYDQSPLGFVDTQQGAQFGFFSQATRVRVDFPSIAIGVPPIPLTGAWSFTNCSSSVFICWNTRYRSKFTLQP